MGYSKRQFVEAAYNAIGIASNTFDLQPQEYQDGVRTLDSMMAAWNADNIYVSYPLPNSPQFSDVDQVTEVPDAANEAIIYNLALRLAGIHGKQVDPITLGLAKRAKDALDNHLIRRNDPPVFKPDPLLPTGSAYRLRGYWWP